MSFQNSDTKTLLEIIKSRRDVRGNRFLSREIEEEKLHLILKSATMAPSVGYCQPWRFIVIKNQQIKNEIYNNFQSENQKAKEQFKDSKLYQNLKLEGIKEAPINIAVLYEAPKKTTLGMTSIEKSGEYSVVCAVQNMWLVARSLNIGVGWVSILDEKRVLKTIDETNSKLIAYLCVGYVDEFLDEPELKKLKWEDEKKLDDVVKYI